MTTDHRAKQPEVWFTTADVEAARQRLNDNRYGGPDDFHDLDREDITEIVQIVLTATWQRAYERGLREATEGWERHLRWRSAEGQAVEFSHESYVEPYVRQARRLERQYGYEPGELQQQRRSPWEPADTSAESEGADRD